MIHPFRIRVPASASNLGAGFDCIGLALDLWLELDVSDGVGTFQYAGSLQSLNPDSDIIKKELVAAGIFSKLSVLAASDIPLGKGLGSSAAAAVAAFVAIAMAQESEPTRNEIFLKALEYEGHPDNAAPATFGGLVLAAGQPTPLPFHETLGVALAIPDTVIDTKTSRSALPNEFHRNVAVEQAGRAAALSAGLTGGNGDLIRFGMEDKIAVPSRKQLVAGYDDAVDAGIAAGAYGVTISGSGSTLIGISPKERSNDVAEAMCEALGKNENPAAPLTPNVVEGGYTIAKTE